MRQLINKIVKSLAYLVAALVIFLAVAVGLFRLLLPKLPEYQEEIKGWANSAIGMEVEFADMIARWRLSGPELTFQDAELTIYDAETSLLTAREVSVGVSLMRLLRDRELVVDRIQIRGTKLTLQFSEHDGWLAQGLPLTEVIGSREVTANQTGNVVVVAEDIEIDYLVPDSSNILSFVLDTVEISRDDTRVLFDAVIDLPESMGQRLDISATQRSVDKEQGIWQFFVEGKALSIPGWSALDVKRFPQFQSGSLDLSASLRRSSAGIDSATADFVLNDLAGTESETFAPVDLQGRAEYAQDRGGWLIAASNFVVSTVDGTWPRSDLSVEVSTAGDESVTAVSASASFLNLDDWRYFAEWFPADLRVKLEQYDPSGVLRNLRLSLDAMQSEDSQFSISAEMDGAGAAATDSLPGLRRLSGLIRADNLGGRLEIASAGLVVDLASLLQEPIAFDDAIGTIIWRRNAQGLIILSDSIRIRNADLDSQSSLQINLPAGAAAPIVDFQSNWSVNDISAVKRYLPAKLIKPNLYKWLDAALVSGNAPRGTTQLTGPLDKFPFDNGEGIFRIESHLENTTLRYSDLWPDVENMTLDIVIDGMRLYSDRNSSSTRGNSVVDAKIDIPDLRKPILSIDAFATGSLESIRQFSKNSPIGRLFGGHLEQVTVDGDASFNLHVTYPILKRTDYNFSTRIQISDGTLSFSGFRPQLTGVNGIVNVSRDDVSSESLFGHFLGEQVDINLKSAGEAMPSYTVVAEATGLLSDSGIIEELAPPLENIISGSSAYKLSMKFPKGGVEQPLPFQINVDTDLAGMAVDLPVPLQKKADVSMPLSFSIEFPEAGRIVTNGSWSDDLNWTMSFISAADAGWDFDRGTLAVGGDYPSLPDIRGLLISGETPSVSLDEWLGIARKGGGSVGIADRIRTVDLVIGNLHVIGQDIKDHRVEVQRSAQDWLVSISGEQITGSITVPYDFESGRPLVLDMETLILPGADEALASTRIDREAPDPRNVPPLQITAKEFALGERFFGELKATFEATERGMESTTLSTRDASFSVEGEAGWIIDTTDETGQRTYMNAILASSDIQSTMSQLKYEPGITGDDLELNLDISWSGGPREDFLDKLDGTVGLRVGVGTLEDVEPGAGRVFGLLSVVALPRRLSLDFGDVFDKGFGFDKITGTFRIQDGQAYTCDLSLEGPAADVGITGRAGLATRDYDQTALVSANVGNTLPIVAAVVAGPQVAAALLIFSQIFKKPLQEVGQIYYGIEGSWDAPDVTVSNVARFAKNSGDAGCIEVAE